MHQYELPRKTLTLWRIRVLFMYFIILLACSFLTFNLYLLFIAFGISTALFCALFFWYLPRLHKCCKISLNNGAVTVRTGIIFKNTYILPFPRLIYTQVISTPLSRLFGVTAIVLKAARSRIFVPEIDSEDAVVLIDTLSEVCER